MRKRFIFHGRVQGVGFRMTTEQIAKGYPVVGYVKNLPDGTVEIVADGSDSAISTFVTAIEQHFDGYIQDRQDNDDTSDESFQSFQIRY